MLFHNVLCVCFLALLAPKIETNAEHDPASERPEGIFADVIRNISRVNTELQDLINNYEQFKKLQSSQEKFNEKGINYLSDQEGGRVNRNNKNIGNNRVSSHTTSKYQTKMIFMGESSESEQNSESEKGSQSEQNSEAEKGSQSKHNNEEDQSKEEPTRSMEDTNKKKRQKTQKTTTEANIAKEPTFERETENQKHIDIHSSINTNKEPETIIEETFKGARNSEKEKQTKYIGSDSNSEGEQVMEVEGRASLNNRASDTDEDDDTNKVTAAILLRSGTGAKTSASPDLSDSDGALYKDVFKTNILRVAYGDACLKLVIRKCYKACKQTLKISMRATNMKGKTEVKSFFKKQYKAECDEVFGDKPRTTSESPEPTYRRNLKNGTLNRDAVTQSEYLSMVCQSDIPLRRMLKNDTTVQTIAQVNILRDKYERACQRISQKKCMKACNKAKDATCKKFECQKRLKKNFKRNCKSSCKRAYKSKSKGSSSDSNNGSGSDSDDDSDDKSDSESSKSKSK